jgi:hypothetical protein
MQKIPVCNDEDGRLRKKFLSESSWILIGGRNGTSREIGRGETPSQPPILDFWALANTTLSTVYATELPAKSLASA